MPDETQHSPLPWALDRDQESAWNVHIVQANAPHMRVCFMTSDGPSEANARLIVSSVNAVPALVAALESAREYVDADTDTDRADGSRQAVRLRDQIDAALAEYRGGDCDCFAWPDKCPYCGGQPK